MAAKRSTTPPASRFPFFLCRPERNVVTPAGSVLRRLHVAECQPIENTAEQVVLHRRVSSDIQPAIVLTCDAVDAGCRR